MKNKLMKRYFWVAMMLIPAVVLVLSVSMSGAQSPSIEGAIVLPQAPALEPTPQWGTTSEIVRTVGAYEFQPYAVGEDISSNFMSRYTSTAVGSTDYITASFQLPTGATITRIEFDGCNNNATAAMSIELYSGSGNSISFIGFGGAAAASAGCGKFSGNLPHAVDNTQTYLILWNPGGTGAIVTDGSELLTSVRIYYKLQISPAPATATFSDVPTSHPFFQHIEALAASGITTGFADGTYRPDNYVTRASMAAFLARALGLHWPD